MARKYATVIRLKQRATRFMDANNINPTKPVPEKQYLEEDLVTPMHLQFKQFWDNLLFLEEKLHSAFNQKKFEVGDKFDNELTDLLESAMQDVYESEEDEEQFESYEEDDMGEQEGETEEEIADSPTIEQDMFNEETKEAENVINLESILEENLSLLMKTKQKLVQHTHIPSHYSDSETSHGALFEFLQDHDSPFDADDDAEDILLTSIQRNNQRNLMLLKEKFKKLGIDRDLTPILENIVEKQKMRLGITNAQQSNEFQIPPRSAKSAKEEVSKGLEEDSMLSLESSLADYDSPPPNLLSDNEGIDSPQRRKLGKRRDGENYAEDIDGAGSRENQKHMEEGILGEDNDILMSRSRPVPPSAGSDGMQDRLMSPNRATRKIRSSQSDTRELDLTVHSTPKPLTASRTSRPVSRASEDNTLRYILDTPREGKENDDQLAPPEFIGQFAPAIDIDEQGSTFLTEIQQALDKEERKVKIAQLRKKKKIEKRVLQTKK
jgi:hypothetical protein